MREEVIAYNARRKVRLLLPHLKGIRTILDFGCGDLSLAKQLRRVHPRLAIAAVDVVDFGIRENNITFRTYDGKKLPYKNGRFDGVIAFHVLHHCTDSRKCFSECARVAKRRLLIVEPVWRIKPEIILMSILDWVWNAWKDRSIPMQYTYRSRKEWEQVFARHKLHIDEVLDVEPFPKWLPTGRSLLFVLSKE